MQLLLVQHSPHTGGLFGLLVDVGPQGRLPGRDGLGCGARGAVSAGRAASARVAPGQWPRPCGLDKAGAPEVRVRGVRGKIKSGFLISEVSTQ